MCAMLCGCNQKSARPAEPRGPMMPAPEVARPEISIQAVAPRVAPAIVQKSGIPGFWILIALVVGVLLGGRHG